MDRRRFIELSGGTVLVTGLAGCLGGGGGDGGDGGDGDGDGGTPTETMGEEPTWVGMVYAESGLGDKSFSDSAHRGIKQAAEDFTLEFDNAEPDSVSEMEPIQRRLAQSDDPDYDLICCIGFTQTEGLQENAPDFPDQNWMIVDSVVEEPNVASYVFKEHEGSFQVGHLAGLMTQRDFSAGEGSTKPDQSTVGFIGGRQIPLIEKFEAGFKAGVEYAGGESLSGYIGSFTDVNTAKEIALDQYSNGADIVYHAAGPAGGGLFQAARDQSRYAIGVDSDQSVTASEFADYILASMIKRVDRAVYESSEQVVNDDFDGGSIQSLGLAEDGVATGYGQSLGPEIPEEVKSQVAETKTMIADGDIDVPSSLDELEDWDP